MVRVKLVLRIPEDQPDRPLLAAEPLQPLQCQRTSFARLASCSQASPMSATMAANGTICDWYGKSNIR
jgi:hypothetical protein